LTTSQEEWRRPAAALGRLVCARGFSPIAGCPLLLSQAVSFGRMGANGFTARVAKSSRRRWRTFARGALRRQTARERKAWVPAPRRRPVRYRPPEAIEGSFRQTDPGEILPGLVRRRPRFLHLLPFQSARVHPRAGCRRQISRQRRGVLLRRRRLDWRGGNRWSRRKVNCRTPPGRTRWTCRGQRRCERWVWFRGRIQRERRPEGELSGGQNKPRQGIGQCQESASAWRDHTSCYALGIPFKSTASWSETRFHPNRITF